MSSPRNPKRVFIGVCIRDGQSWWNNQMSFLKLLSRELPAYEFIVAPGGGCDVAHARNLLNHQFMRHTDAGLCLHVDADVVFEPDHILRLIQHFESKPDMMICAGLYPLKGLDLRWSYGLFSAESEKHPGLWEVGELCGGFLMYRYELVEEMERVYPYTRYVIDDQPYRGQENHELFAMGVVQRDWGVQSLPGDPIEYTGPQPIKCYPRRVSEDFYFSMRARDVGHTLYADPTIQLGHMGSINLLDLHTKAGEVALPRL